MDIIVPPTGAGQNPPPPGEFCEPHWSWLCQAGQGKCQSGDA